MQKQTFIFFKNFQSFQGGNLSNKEQLFFWEEFQIPKVF
jgi:hypothetical protein